MMRISLVFAACILIFGFIDVAQAQVTVSGTVVSADSNEPIANVTVVVAGTLIGTVTDSEGAYSIDLRSAQDVLVFSYVGYRTQRHLVEAGVTTLDVALEPDVVTLEEISVVSDELRTFASNIVSAPMIRQQPALANLASIVDNLPGVSVQEGDSYGMEDWSSNIVMRGFQVTINEAQIGTTVDGIPNGSSDYWSGSKASRFMDISTLGTVEVSQGTADISSTSLEALGGTLNYTTDDPAAERIYKVSATFGERSARRVSMRIDTGPIFGNRALAWIAAASQQSTDWIEGSAENEREHLAAKVTTRAGALDLVGYVSYDRIRENNYQRLYSESDFDVNPNWDRLIGTWAGIPYLNQFYRQGWETRRGNTLVYVQGELTAGMGISVDMGAYYHANRGRGDWLPPYIVDITDDNGGPESELVSGSHVEGGSQLGVIRFVDSDGRMTDPVPGCTSSFIFNYYGGGGPEVDPACHPGASAVQSFRHSHYGKDRAGANLDANWFTNIGSANSSLRVGVWFEESSRHLGRDWHRVIDPTIGYAFEEVAYWHQYEWDFPQTAIRWYADETIYVGSFTARAGVRQYLVELSRVDDFGVDSLLTVNTDSDLLFSGGITWDSPLEGLSAFAGFSQNYKAISALSLEVPGRSLEGLAPESASNIDIGLQYTGNRVALSGTLYSTDFENRVIFLGPQTAAGPNYLIPGGGAYFNAGGLSARGLEGSVTVQLPNQISAYTAFSVSDSEYIGSGDPAVDANQGIEPGTDVTGVPSRLWVVSLDRAGPLGAGVSAKYTARRRVSLTADWYADSYWMVDGYIRLSGATLGDMFRTTEFSLVGNNLFDVAYLSSITENAAWLGAPRSISLTATVTF
ncbi:MAG: carboxypeptidase-like regulatory domain-containing protein [Bacteroidota bacterium]|nr:carboxypeptidase-like regulatory domain-containing protein [Bacteroidota bacterium]MDE2833576.1 carboxypeptidase-like regulatory domain-containing protein [Bacteroidota bacterium]